jgi:hypothetical protein
LAKQKNKGQTNVKRKQQSVLAKYVIIQKSKVQKNILRLHLTNTFEEQKKSIFSFSKNQTCQTYFYGWNRLNPGIWAGPPGPSRSDWANKQPKVSFLYRTQPNHMD